MKTLKKLLSILLVIGMLSVLLVSTSACGTTSRTAGTVDGESIPAGMYIYFLHSAITSLEQQYQYGNLSSEDSSSEEVAETESSESSEEVVETESVESSEEVVETESTESTESPESSEAPEESTEAESSSEDNKPDTLWDARIDGKSAEEYVKEQAYKNCVWVILMEKKAKEYNIEFTADDYKEIEENYANNGGKSVLEDSLTAMGVSMSSYDRIFKASIIQDHLEELLYGSESGKGMSKEDMQKEYKENYRRVKHILFQTSDITDEKDADGNVTKTADELKAETKASFEAVLKRAQGGENYEELVKEYNSDSMDAEKGYIFKKGDMVEEFEKAAWDLPVGTVSSCETQYGYHIIKAYDLDEKYMEETLSDVIKADMDEKYGDEEEKWLDELMTKLEKNSSAERRYSPKNVYEDNDIASNVSAQIEYYNSYYSQLMAQQNAGN